MKYDLKPGAGDLTVMMHGDLSFQDHPVFKKLLAELGAAGQKRWVFDLQNLSSIDSAGIGMLLIARDNGDAEGATLSLRAPQGNVRKVLDLTRIGDMMPISA